MSVAMKNVRIKGRSLFVQGFNAMKQPWGLKIKITFNLSTLADLQLTY